jgi:TetR/AcrR family transcriptional regulator, repressor of fatR-cypB operon
VSDDNEVSAAESAGPRERVLQAALELFVEQGYFNTNVPDISKRSRCSVGSIYHHFLNKEDIASQLYKEGLSQFRTAISEVIEEHHSVEEALEQVIVAFLNFAETNYLLSRYLWLARHNEFLSNKVLQPTVVGFDRLGRKLTQVLKRGIKEKEIPPLKAQVIWTILFGIPISYIRDWLEGYTSDTPTSVAPILSKACWAALHGAHK